MTLDGFARMRLRDGRPVHAILFLSILYLMQCCSVTIIIHYYYCFHEVTKLKKIAKKETKIKKKAKEIVVLVITIANSIAQTNNTSENINNFFEDILFLFSFVIIVVGI